MDTTSRAPAASELETADAGRDEKCAASDSGAGDESHSHSYIQVVVQPGRGARMPAASSPAAPAPQCRRAETERAEECGGEEHGWDEARLAQALRRMLLPAPPCTHQYVRNKFPSSVRHEAGEGGGDAHAQAPLRPQKAKSSWKIFNLEEKNIDTSDCGPERFEVYYFEDAEAAQLATGGGARAGRVRRATRPLRRRAAAARDELLAAARLLLAAPVALLLALHRCCLEALRDLVSGVVQNVSDYGLKPALALVYNALLHPPLVFAGSVARGARAALRPALAALGDALEPLARVLGAVRLVHVHVQHAPSSCTCRHHATDSTNT